MPVNSIPFQIPGNFQPAYAAGELARYGGLLKDVNTGQIVAHLQETGGLLDLLSGAGDVAATALRMTPFGIIPEIGVQILSSIAMKPQLNRIEEKLGILTNLQIAGLATSVVGIGVTAAGTAIILKRIRALNTRVSDIAGSVDTLPEQWRSDDLHRTINRVETHLERLAEIPVTKNPGKIAHSADEALHEGYNAIFLRLMSLKNQPEIDAELYSHMISALSQCGAAQVRALFWLDDLERAKQRAQTHMMRQTELALALPGDEIERRLILPNTESAARQKILEDILEMRRRLASVPILASDLQSKGIAGPDYLAEIDNRKDEPLLLMAV